MYQITENNYKKLPDYSHHIINELLIYDFPSIIQIPNISGLYDLNIDNCMNLICISKIQNLNELYIVNCPNLIQIPDIQKLNTIFLKKCLNIIEIPIIQNLSHYSYDIVYHLYIYKCPKLIHIPNIKELASLAIENCNLLYDIETEDKNDIIRYLSILKITRWFKRIIFLKSKQLQILWDIAHYYTAKKYAPANILKYTNLD